MLGLRPPRCRRGTAPLSPDLALASRAPAWPTQATLPPPRPLGAPPSSLREVKGGWLDKDCGRGSKRVGRARGGQGSIRPSEGGGWVWVRWVGRAGWLGRAGGMWGGQAARLASISTILTSRTVESEVPSGHAVLGAQQKLSAQQPAPRKPSWSAHSTPRMRPDALLHLTRSCRGGARSTGGGRDSR